MSNIHTSYIRIYRRDKKDINKIEADRIFDIAVRAYGEFGSYWVRILKKYRPEEKCLDIQFGSGKRYHSGNLLEDYEIYNKYFVWERFSDEGGFNDTIFTLKEDEHNKWIEETPPVSCLYGFDKILIKCNELPEYFNQFNFMEGLPNQYELKITGSYYACNSRSFMDVNENSTFYGPKLGYDPEYNSDYFIPTTDGGITDSDSNLIKDVFIYPNKKIINGMRVELLWKNRMVQAIEKKVNEVVCYSADYWDNCFDKCYLEFLNKEVDNTM